MSNASEPVVPDASYLRAVTTATELAVAHAEPLRSEFAGADSDTRGNAEAWLAQHGDELVGLSRDVHAHPEEGFAEHRTVERVAELLRRHGIEPEVGVGGLDTALQARCGTGRPHVAVLAEYDALPGIGHGCGHNIICSSGVGGFLAAAQAVRTTEGSVSLIGTPAEEGGGGKEILAQAGIFDDVDAVIMLHPFSHDVATHPFLGRRQVGLVFHGVAAHASAQPFMGRNALDAVVAAYQGVAALRQHLPSTDRVHGIITDGGKRPNVVPDRAAALFYLRSGQPETLRDLANRVDRIARGAAEMTGCGVEVNWDDQPAYLPIRHSTTLAARWAHHQSALGRTSLPPGVVPESLTGSTDLGNLSYRMPAIHPMIALDGDNLALHTEEFAAAAGSPTGDRAVLDGSAGLALTAVDYLADPALRAAVHEEFEAAGGTMDFNDRFGA